MGKMDRWFTDKLKVNPAKGIPVDLREWQDDKTILHNPHKGWYWHYFDGGLTDHFPAYRRGYESITRGKNGEVTSLEILDAIEDFPGLNHLYFRFNWGDIEKQEDQDDWSYIDAVMEKWGARGYRFGFSLCTFMGNLDYATPKWVLDAGAKYNDFFIDGQMTKEPVYNDPIYLEKLEKFMRRYGEKFNGHPLVEYIDVGTFGTWGEGHSSLLYPVETVKKHFDLHTDNFSDTPVSFNDDFISNRFGREIVPGESQGLLDYAVERGMCLFDASIMYADYIQCGGYDGLLAPTVYDACYPNGPINTEFCHYYYYTNPEYAEGVGQSLHQDGYRALAALQRGRVTYAGFHGYPREFLENFTSFAYYCANRLGYWYFLDIVQIPRLVSGKTSEVTLLLSNRGFARCSVRYDVKWRLVPAEGVTHTLLCDTVDNRKWEPVYVAALEQCTEVAVPLDLRAVPPGRYRLQLGMFEGKRSIEWGISRELLDDGFYHITDVVVE